LPSSDVSDNLFIRYEADTKMASSMARLPLMDFNPLCDPLGYRLAWSDKFRCQVILRNGPRNGYLAHRPQLSGEEFRSFANMARDAEGALEFVRLHGAFTPSFGHGALGEPVESITLEARAMRRLLDAIAAAPRQLPDEVLHDLTRLMGSYVWTEFEWDPMTKTPVWKFCPGSLRDALWLQFGQAVTRGDQLRACLRCGDWFEVGVGTGRRADAKFCCDEHRKVFNSLKRSKR
jgi:hypothetical protein